MFLGLAHNLFKRQSALNQMKESLPIIEQRTLEPMLFESAFGLIAGCTSLCRFFLGQAQFRVGSLHRGMVVGEELLDGFQALAVGGRFFEAQLRLPSNCAA